MNEVQTETKRECCRKNYAYIQHRYNYQVFFEDRSPYITRVIQSIRIALY